MMDSEQKLFEDATRNAYHGGDWLRVVYEGGSHGACLMINPDTGQCRGGLLGMNISYSRFKSKVIKEMKRKKRERGKLDSMIKKNATIINEIEVLRSLGETANESN